jgi:low temperature requirement protein LtrA
VAGVVRGVAAAGHLSLASGLTALAGLALSFGLWWTYFDYVGRWRPRHGPWSIFAWNYLHLPLVMSLAAIGAGVLDLIAPETAVAAASLHRLIAGATAVALLTIGLIERTLLPDPLLIIDRRRSSTMKLATAAAAGALALAGGALTGGMLLLGLIALLAVHMVYATYVWYLRSGDAAPVHAGAAPAVASPG